MRWHGAPPLLASFDGAREIGFAVIATTATLMAVFVPLAFMTGNTGKLFREFKFDSYQEGVDFAVRVAELAERLGHHPDLHIYHRHVRVNYFTHSAGGVTVLDIEGAQAVNELLKAKLGI